MVEAAPGALRMLSVFPGFGVGGTQMRFAALARHFGGAFDHVIVSLNGDIACRERMDPSLSVRFADAGPRQRGLPATLAAASRVLRAERPDLVVTSNWGAIEWAMAARLCGLRHIHTEDGFGPEERERQISRRVITRRLALRGSDVVLPSRTLLSIASDIWRLPERCLHHIPNGVDLRRFAVSRAGPPAGPRVIGTIAALRPEKALSRLIEAFAILAAGQEVRLVIGGDGPERGLLEAGARALGVADRVVFAGHTDTPETLLAEFDLFALSSDTEQMPLSVIEAMASGLPVASTDVGDVRSMLAAPHVCDRTAADLARTMGEALADLGAGAANLLKAEREFGQARMFEAYGRLFRNDAR